MGAGIKKTISRGLLSIIPLAAFAAAAGGCTSGNSEPESAQLVDFALLTEGSDTNSGAQTISVYLFNPTGTTLQEAYTGLCGTYVCEHNGKSGEEHVSLKPCTVTFSDNGRVAESYKVDYQNGGLYAPPGKYRVVAISPAVMGFWPYERKAIEQQQRVSDPVEVTISGRGKIGNAGDTGEEIHITPLKERRAMIRFKLQCTQQIIDSKANLEVATVYFRNLLDNAYWNPLLDAFDETNLPVKKLDIKLFDGSTTTQPTTITTTTPILMPDPLHTGGVQLHGVTASDGNCYNYILAENYTLANDENKYIHTIPELEITLKTGIKYNVPVIYDFAPHTIYTFRMVLNTNKLSVYVQSAPWDHVGASTGFDNPEIKLFDLRVNSWQKGGGGNADV